MILKRNKSVKTSQPIPNLSDKAEATVIKRSPKFDLKNLKKPILVAAKYYKPILALLFAVYLTAAFYQTWRVKDAYGVYGGEVISRQQFEHSSEANEKSFKKVQENFQKELAAEGHSHPEVEYPSNEIDVEEYTRSQLVLAWAIEKDADRYDIGVSQAEIDAVILNDPIFYSSGRKGEATVEAIREIYRNELGWTDEDLDLYYKTQLYQQKLENKLIESRDVLNVTSRWNINQPDMDQYEKKFIARRTIEDVVVPWLKDGSLNRADITVRLEGYNKQPAVKDLAPSRADYVYMPQLDTDELKSLLEDSSYNKNPGEILAQIKKPGQFTEILESKDGYFSVFWIDGITNGEYSSWDNYIAAKEEQANFFSSSTFDIGRLIYGLTHPFS